LVLFTIRRPWGLPAAPIKLSTFPQAVHTDGDEARLDFRGAGLGSEDAQTQSTRGSMRPEWRESDELLQPRDVLFRAEIWNSPSRLSAGTIQRILFPFSLGQKGILE
jgi:hypothetical protein